MNVALIALAVATGILLLGLILVFCMYKEAKNNYVLSEEEKEEDRRNFKKAIQEKDSEIQGLMTEKDELNASIEIQKNDYEEKIRSAYKNFKVGDDQKIVDIAFLNEKDREIMQKEAEAEEYKNLATELVKDIHELEDRYVQQGGDLSVLYEDYNEYYE